MIDEQTAPVPHFGLSAPCGSNSEIGLEFKFSHGGARPGAGRKPNPAASVVARVEADDALRWHCLRTSYQAELTADIAIRLAGFTVFAPTIWKPATTARRNADGSMRAALPDRLAQLFPRYLFAKFRWCGDDWQQIRRLPGVDGILPTAVSDDAIDLIRDLDLPEGRMSPNGCLYPDNVELGGQRAAIVHPTPLAAGSSARLIAGPMADLTGICAWSDGRRVRLLFEILGRPVVVTVAQAAVEAA